MPESSRVIQRALERSQFRFRLIAIADALMVGSVTAGLGLLLFAELQLRATYTTVLVAGVFLATTGITGARWWRGWTLSRVARAIEQRCPGFDNLLVTAEEALAGRALHPVLVRELYDQAAGRLRSVAASSASQPLVGRAVLALGMCTAVGFLILRAGEISPVGPIARTASDTVGPLAGGPVTLRVTVIPPPYTRALTRTIDDPAQVQVLEGSTVRVELAGAADPVQLVEPGREPVQFERVNGSARLDLVASASRVLLIRRPAIADGDRLLQLQVEADRRPTVTIEQPTRDMLFATPTGTLPVRVAARDDLQLVSLVLRFTRIAGSGEAFAFEEGEIPLLIRPAEDGAVMTGEGVISLERLELEDGDTLVYRALARDRKPGADPSTSESFLIEIGKRSEAASTGFALPEERDRQALSQQMLIMKTERLIVERSRLTAEAFLERSRMLAVEQRMVRAEFVFMTGGEVQDEVEEAAQAHEIVEGRFENQGQVELLKAIREMSRAEARLNAADTAPALVFERAALIALQRAFDRRRYFLRTLSERARIDGARRLSGDLTTARSSTRAPRQPAQDPAITTLRETLRDLAAAARSTAGPDAQLAARILAADPRSTALQTAALRLSGPSRLDDKLGAVAEAQKHLEALLRRHLAVAAARQLPRDPFLGQLADQLAPISVPR